MKEHCSRARRYRPKILGSPIRIAAAAALLVFLLPGMKIRAEPRAALSGTVKDPSGGAIARAVVVLITPQHVQAGLTATDQQGRFRLHGIPAGSYVLSVASPGFATRDFPVQIMGSKHVDITVVMELSRVSDLVTVTAEAGQAQEQHRTAQQTNVIPAEAIRRRATSVLAQAAAEETGLALQRTSPTIGGVFVRGLTGNKVSVFIDGVRYTTATVRGGINTFFNLIGPGNLDSVEVLRGPNSGHFGSDSLGGSVQLLSRIPGFGSTQPITFAELDTFFSSADLSAGSNAIYSYGTQRLGLLLNLEGRRINTLRAGNGIDGHAAVTRFLGLRSDILGSRLPDTAFTQYGGTFHLNFAPRENEQFILHYQRSQQDGGKRYDQLLGGDGNLVADLRNLILDFFYARYVKQGGRLFNTVSITVSHNRQREERVNQGGQGNPRSPITHQYERTRVTGLSAHADKQLTAANTLLLGFDIYHNSVKAPAFTFNPVERTSRPSRPRVPHGARFVSSGLYAQDVWQLLPNRLRASGAVRFNIASYRSRAANSALVDGHRLFPDDSLRVDDFSARAGLVATARAGLNFVFNYSRGFRAPDISDLGTLGLTGDGFEVDYHSAASVGGTVGTTADRDAVSSGQAVRQLRSETSRNFDFGVRYGTGRLATSLTAFITDINGAITKQALVAAPRATGRALGDQTIEAQLASGVVFVPLSPAPVLVRANFSDARYRGLEFSADAGLTEEWTGRGSLTWIRASDRATGRPPNIEGGTPPPTAFLSLRYQPKGRRYWMEAYATLAGRHERLSSLELSDRRNGATRSRTNIANFFNNGARVHGLIGNGADGRAGTADDVLAATGETLNQVQKRVLGDAASLPLYPHIPGYGLMNLRGGFRFSENSEVFFSFENIADRSYRGISWGMDGPGRSITARYRHRFN